MILAIDVGNTNIVLGCMDGSTLRFTARVQTARERTEDEYALIFRNLLTCTKSTGSRWREPFFPAWFPS